jgi:uncharacterized protein (TIGR00730 family)
MKKICVFGTYKSLGKKERDDIVRLGKLLAENGIVVVSGGFGGSMEDVSRGAKSAKGKTVGVTYYKDRDPTYKGANEFIDEEIRTKDIFERIERMMEISDGFIALQGGTGTLLELAAVLEHINKGMMPPKPIIAIGDFWKGVVENLSSELVTFVKDVDEAVKKILDKI